MKIIHIVNSLGAGGAENLVIELSRSMRARGHQVLIISLADKIQYTEKLAAYGLDYATCGFTGTIYRPAEVLRCVREVRKHIRAFAPDIVHSHIFLSDLIGRALTPANARHVTTLHRDEPWWRQPRPLSRLKTRLEGLSARRGSAHFIAVSEHARNEAIRYLGLDADRVDVVMNGVDIAAFQPRTATVARQRPVIVHVARFYPEKAHAVIIEAAALLAQRDVDFELRLIGDGPLRESIEQQVQALGLRDRIHFLGIRQNISELLRDADLFILPSLREGLPISLLEAMATGLPCIVSKVGEMPGVIRDGSNGLLIEPGASAPLADAIARLCADREQAAALAGEARRTVEQNFSIDNTTTEYLRAYSRL